MAATFLAANNSKSVSDKVAKPVVPAQPKQAQSTPPANAQAPAKPQALDAKDAARALLSPGKPVTSGRFSVRLSAVSVGGKHSGARSAATGTFGPSSGGNPTFDVRASEAAAGRAQSVHVRSAGGNGYVLGAARAVLLPGANAKMNAERKRYSGGAAALKQPGIDATTWLKHVKTAPGGKVDGVDTTHVTAVLNAHQVAKDIKGLAHQAGPGGQAAVLPSTFGKGLETIFRGAHVDAYVGSADRTVRRLRVTKTGAAPTALPSKHTPRVRVTFDLSLAQVNKPQQVKAPAQVSKVKPKHRTERLGESVLSSYSVLVHPPAGLAQMAAGYFHGLGVERARYVPNRVDRAIRAHKKVVLFIFQADGVDDPSVAYAVDVLHRRTKAAVFADTLDNLASYGQVVQSVGVTRAPSIVIVSRSGKARLVDGYIDPAALAQEVRDTR